MMNKSYKTNHWIYNLRVGLLNCLHFSEIYRWDLGTSRNTKNQKKMEKNFEKKGKKNDVLEMILFVFEYSLFTFFLRVLFQWKNCSVICSLSFLCLSGSLIIIFIRSSAFVHRKYYRFFEYTSSFNISKTIHLHKLRILIKPVELCEWRAWEGAIRSVLSVSVLLMVANNIKLKSV